LVDSGRCVEREIDAAVAEVRNAGTDDNASSHFIWNRVLAVR